MKISLLLLFEVCLCLVVTGKEAAPMTKVRQMREWNLPSGLIPHPYTGSNDSADARQFIENQGVKFSPSDEVIADSSGNIVVWAEKRETLEQIEEAFTFTGPVFDGISLRVEVELAEFPAAKLPELQGEIPYATLRKAAGNSWRVLNQIVATTIPGDRLLVTSRTGTIAGPSAALAPPQDQPPSFYQTTPLPPGLLGASLGGESSLDETHHIVDLNIDYHYRGAGDRVWNSKWILTLTLADGVPKIAQLDTKPSGGRGSHSATLRVLVVRADIVHPKEAITHFRHHPTASPPAH